MVLLSHVGDKGSILHGPVSTSAMSMKWSSEAEANILPSWLKLSVLAGQSSLQENWWLSLGSSHNLSFHSAILLTWRSIGHTPVPPRPTGWPGRLCCPWRSTSPWDQTWCRCSLMGEHWWTGWTSVLGNCEQKALFRTEDTPAQPSTWAGKDRQEHQHNQSIKDSSSRQRRRSLFGSAP